MLDQFKRPQASWNSYTNVHPIQHLIVGKIHIFFLPKFSLNGLLIFKHIIDLKTQINLFTCIKKGMLELEERHYLKQTVTEVENHR